MFLHRARRSPFSFPGILLLLAAWGCAGVDAADPEGDYAHFRVSEGGVERILTFGGEDHLVMCTRDAGWADLWVRFAGDTARMGGDVPHLDMDLCRLGDGGEFTPHDREALNCDAGKRWIAWWHEDGATFVNPPDASPCTLSLALDGDQLTGTFACRGLAELEGDRRVDLEEGAFRCTVR